MASIMDDEPDKYFKGFERCPRFEHLFHRLQILELWLELAIRPSSLDECDPEDYDLYEQPFDNVKQLQSRCFQVRQQMNHPDHFPTSIQRSNENWEDHLVPQISTIPNAGLGLFYQPDKTTFDDNRSFIPKGTIICYYTGHLHNFHSAKSLVDTSYLMLVSGDCLVDTGPLPDLVKARYINDPTIGNTPNCRNSLIDGAKSFEVNCKFVPEPMKLRSAVVTTCDIYPGQELFVAYGDAYWNGPKRLSQ